MRTERTIRNCRIRQAFQCPKRWEALRPTDDPSMRHCAQCDQNVFFCSTDAETIAHARAGHCVAREQPHPSEMPRLMVGRVSVPPRYTESEEQALKLNRRERCITLFLKGTIGKKARDCPSCGYPVAGFRKKCVVCGLEIGQV